MALSPSFELRQSQSLVMTPQLMQSIKLLQMTAAELEHFIEEALEKNPLLERQNGQEFTEKTDNEAIKNSDAQTNNVFDNSAGAPENFEQNIDSDQNLYETPDPETLSNMFDGGDEAVFSQKSSPEHFGEKEYSSDWTTSFIGSSPIEDVNVVETVAYKPGLQDFVAEQIGFAYKNKEDHDIACYLSS